MHLSISTVDVSNEDDDCMTFSMLFDPFLVVVGKRTRKKLSHDNKIQNKKAMDTRDLSTTDCFLYPYLIHHRKIF